MLDSVNSSHDTATIEELRDHISGEVIAPGDPAYDSGRAGFNLAFDQYPALVVMAANADDVFGAVRYAAEQGLDIAVQVTGHGVAGGADGALLINLAHMTGVTIDPAARTARIMGGTRWGEVLTAAQAHGLAPLLGSSPTVGAVGYTLGGGLGWLSRKYGLCSDSVVSFEVVTAECERITASVEENADLFWGLRGGGGGLAVVTAMTVRLFPVETVYGGQLIYPAESAAAVMRRWREWLPTLPDEMATSVKIMNMPDLEFIPAPLRGRTIVILAGCYCGPVEEGAKLIDGWREWQPPFLDAFRPMPFSQVGDISQDPADPIPALVTGAWMGELTDDAIDALVRFGTLQEERVPLLFVEVRHAGGAVASKAAARNGANAGASGHRDAELLLEAVGMAPAPPVQAALNATIGRMMAAVGPALTGTVYMNFLEGDEKNARVRDGYPAETLARLSALKAKYDPNNRLNRAMAIP